MCIRRVASGGHRCRDLPASGYSPGGRTWASFSRLIWACWADTANAENGARMAPLSFRDPLLGA
ncbi:hypothetical protein HPP92_016794 [Vanilla planifolia]|uniref:Uncharacterized protein n=1 Tax=Vanilla planifolia TaxID=51239 RepID=A0A835QPE8_VANPL|nr:hypothetical protein HPP92_016794 [Vanilla planifolia]